MTAIESAPRVHWPSSNVQEQRVGSLGATAKPGKELEALVSALERILAGSGAVIESPSRRLIDRDTGRTREFDVLITWDHGHHKVVAAIECKDRSRQIGVPEVEAFDRKCSATGVSYKAMVSSKGFARTARKKAEALAITCMDLERVETYDWVSMDFMFGYKRQFGPMDVRVMFRDDGPSAFTGLINHEGHELTDDEVGSLVAGHVPAAAQPDTEVGVTFPVHMRLNVEGWTVVDQNGVVWPIDHLQVGTSFETFREAIPVTKHRYSGGGKEYRFASATIPPSIASGGRVVFMQRDEGDVDVFWVPEPKAP